MRSTCTSQNLNSNWTFYLELFLILQRGFSSYLSKQLQVGYKWIPLNLLRAFQNIFTARFFFLESGSKADSGVQQCDFDSGSECNDIYERQTLEALESFNSEDEMRDSAIYSEGEESGITSPEFNNNRRLMMSPIMRARTMSPSRERQLKKGKGLRHHSCGDDNLHRKPGGWT